MYEENKAVATYFYSQPADASPVYMHKLIGKMAER